jgi:D-sedoheptulose 7-phosphate isomerase
MNSVKKDIIFLKNYLNDLSDIIRPGKDIINDLIQVRNIFLKISKKKGKILIFGNGGSAAIASHVSVDLTKNAKIRTVNFNESDLITCFSNDYGYERWIEKAVDFYADPNDALVLISSSGKSKNMLNACKAAKRKKIKIISLTGHTKNNPLSKVADLSLWINSKAYNFVENTHQIWLLTVCDLIIGKREYPAKKKLI